MSDDATDSASGRYDDAEQAYLSALASGAEESALLRLARDVAEAAQVWQSVDSDIGQPPGGVARYYDVPEVIATLWRDLAEAHTRRAG